MDRARAPGRRLPAGNQGHARPDPSHCSSRWRATGATGTAARATRASPCTSASASRPSVPSSSIPPSTTRIASSRPRIGDRDRRVDLRAERRQGLPRQDALSRGARRATPRRSADAGRPLVLCGDLNVARTERDVHPKERKPRAIGQLRRSARCSSGSSAAAWSTSAARSIPTTTRLFTWWPPWRNMRERNIGWRLDYVLASAGARRTRARLSGPEGRRHERPRAGRGDLREVAGRVRMRISDRPFLDRFLRYVAVRHAGRRALDHLSRARDRQLVLLRDLADELRALGLTDVDHGRARLRHGDDSGHDDARRRCRPSASSRTWTRRRR